MQKALIEEKKQRASEQKTDKETNGVTQLETNFSRRSYTTSSQSTCRSSEISVRAENPDFKRRSTSLVQHAPLQEASPGQSKKDVPISLSVQGLPALVSASTASPANTLEEARKKLAALKYGLGTTVPSMPPLASNINDPRGRKGINLPETNNNKDNDLGVALQSPPPMRTPSPIPPPPRMKAGTWASFSNVPQESAFTGQHAVQRNSVPPGDSRGFGDALAHEPRSFYGTDSREPRDPRIWKSKTSQQQQHQQAPQAQIPPYSSDPRRSISTYSGFEESANRGQTNSKNNNNHNQNQNVTANGSAYIANWSGNPYGNGPNPRPPFPSNQNGNEYAGGFNGSHSFRGGFRGGHNKRGFGRHNDVPRTYGEHRKAKARAEAEAKAKAAAEVRQLETEVSREMEAQEKSKQQKEKPEESEAEKSTIAVTQVPELDTSYRNVNLGVLNKKLDFRIPKKTLPPATTITSTSPVNGNGENPSCPSNSPTSKSCDANQDKDTYKNKDRYLNKAKAKDKVDKGNEVSENNLDKSEKLQKSQDKKANDKENKSDKKEKKRLNREPEKKSKVENPLEIVDSNSVVSEESSENTDNVENEPPLSETNASPVPELATSTQDSQQDQSVSEELDILAKNRRMSGTKIKTPISSTGNPALKRRADDDVEDKLENPTKKNCAKWEAKPDKEKSEDDTIDKIKSMKVTKFADVEMKVTEESKSAEEEEITEQKESTKEKESTVEKESTEEEEGTEHKKSTEEKDKPPKISKIKIVLTPIAHTTQVVRPNDGFKNNQEKILDNMATDEHDDEEVPGPPAQFLRRIMQRRNSLAPTYMKPMVDKDKIASSSFTYEDLPEQKRGNQNARNLAIIFEKTSDNCSVSTQNIINGKRRTRGCETSFNETQLSRNIFGMGQINRSRPKASEGKATRAKISVPAKDSTRADDDPIPTPNLKRKRQAIHKETENDVEMKPKKARLEAQEINGVSVTPDEQQVENNVEVTQKEVEAISSEPLPSSEVEPTRKPRTKPRKNELDKLNDDIAQMYYGEEVMRATSRRACTRRSRTSSHTRTSSQHSRTSSVSRTDSISTVSDISSIIVRNTARRGRGIRSSENGINRATFNASLNAKKPKLCRVRIKRCVALMEMIKDQEKEEQEKKEQKNKEPKKKKVGVQKKPLKSKPKRENSVILNTNPEWHSISKAVIKCVVCSKWVRRSPLSHYMMCHKEHYAARLPPDVLKELRAGRGNRPDYWVSQRGGYTLHFTCPFCQKPLLLCQKGMIEHLIGHMGESRFYCSNCNMPQNRLSRLLDHTASCGPGAKPLSSKTVCLPMSVHVCHICQFMQYSKENMDRHLTVQHGLTKEELESVEREELMLCDTTDVPYADSNKDGSAVGPEIPKNKPKSKASAALSNTTKKNKQQKKTNSRFMKMVKKSVSLLKREREEQDDQNMTQANEGSEVPELPPPPPEMEPLFVVNECLMTSEMDTDMEEVLEQPVQHMSLMVDEKPVTLLSGATEQMEPSVPDPEPVVPSAQDDGKDVNEDEDVDVEAVVDSLQSHTDQTATSMLAEVSLAELAGDVLDGIGSDASDYEMDDNSEQVDTTNKNGYGDDDDDALTDDWVDLETAKRNSKSAKSIFRVFNRFCSRLNKLPRSSRAVPSNGSENSDGSDNNDDDGDNPDPSELMPTMQPLEPEPEMGDSSTSTGAKSLSERVENVGFQKPSSDEDQNRVAASYYCVQPGCTFLFSNELEGLENHFALEHPLVRWSGKCGMCRQKITATETNLRISEELRHMRDVHMKDISTLPPPQSSAVESPAVIESCLNQREPVPESEPDPVPELPKLRVRRFTGDRLVVDSQAEKSQPVAIVVSDDDNPRNGMLRDLLAADPRPPNQQLDLQAAGLGEFLCAKPDSPSTEPVKQTPVIVGYSSGLGLKIGQVLSRTQISANLRLSPVVNDPLPEKSSAPAAVEENRNRFRCMATNCNFVAHKLMFMREHMKFHSYSFSSTGHLNCAYCSHVAVDVDDYLRHGVIIHDLAPRSELESSTGPPSVTQKIRDMLSQRENGRVPPPTPQVTLSDVVLGLLECTGYSGE